MKPKFRAAALLLAATMALGSTTALAADKKENTIYSLNGATVTFAESSTEKMTVTYGNGLTDGTQYLILMVKGTPNENTTVTDNGTLNTTDVSYTINENTILFIDQVTATDGKIEFTVYPSSMQDSVILITSTDGTMIAAIVDAAVVLGDLNNDGKINSTDAVLFNKYLAKIDNLDATAMSAADINGDNKVNSADVVILNRYLAKLITTLG
jgi:hypothetical protein